MKFLVVVNVILLVACNASKKTGDNRQRLIRSKYPIAISYKNKDIPDSISNFFYASLSSKGLNVVNYMDLLSSWSNNVRSSFSPSPLTSGSNSQTLQRSMRESMNKMGNILALNINADTKPNLYSINSISWKIMDFPIRDTNGVYKPFIVPNTIKGNNFSIIEAFIDSLVSNKNLSF